MLSEKTRIQNFLIALASGASFALVTYDKTTNLATLNDDPDAMIHPTGVLCNEVKSIFDADKRQGQRVARKRVAWQFELLIGFNREVSLEAFEQSLLDPVPQLAADAENGYSSVRLHLLSTEVEHPVQQEPEKGTKARLTFNAEPHRA